MGGKMEGNIPNEFVDDVRNRFDIVEIIAEYIQLKRSGRNYFGLCPFHGEKTPSFSVSQDKQIFHCFGCGEGGNLFSFLMKMEGYSFPEAVKELAGRAGIVMPELSANPVALRAENEKKHLLTALQWATRFYRHALRQNDEALQYLHKRGLTRETIDLFGLGYAPDAWRALKDFLRQKGCKESHLLEAGLLSTAEKNTYDRFRNRIMYPIGNHRGEVIAFGGRIIGDGLPKYLNSPETPLFDKSKTLYALQLAREAIRLQKQAVIFEGYMDVIAAHQAGIKNAVASLGTSLTDAQARLLRNQADEVVIVYDADAAGQAAAWRGLQVLRQAGCLVKVGRLPKGMDPDDYIRRHGGEEFRRQIIDRALLLVDYQLVSLAEQYSLEKDEERIRLFEKITHVLAAVDNAMEREDYLVKAAGLLKISTAAIREELKKKKQAHAPKARQLVQIKSIAGEGAAEKAPLQTLALWARFPAFIASTVHELEDGDFPAELVLVFREVQNRGNMFTPAHLLDMLPEEKYRQNVSRLLIEEEFDEKIAKKALDDCVRYLKCARFANRRKELEAKIAKLDPVAAKGEIAELSRLWLDLRKMEETINQPKEGGKGVG